MVKTKTHIGKVVCVGRNYQAHAQELGNSVPSKPLLFIKPASSVVPITDNMQIASHIYNYTWQQDFAVHYETELCLQIGAELQNLSAVQIKSLPNAISGITVGLDLTLRELQSQLKDKAQPWERAKCFKGACVLGDWLATAKFEALDRIEFELLVDDVLKQHGNTADMVFKIYDLLADISHAFGLQQGDVVMTGTPKGVGQLCPNQQLILKLAEHRWQITVL